MVKVIKNEGEYDATLAEIDSLLDLDPDPGTPEADRLEVLTLLVRLTNRGGFRSRLPIRSKRSSSGWSSRI